MNDRFSIYFLHKKNVTFFNKLSFVILRLLLTNRCDDEWKRNFYELCMMVFSNGQKNNFLDVAIDRDIAHFGQVHEIFFFRLLRIQGQQTTRLNVLLLCSTGSGDIKAPEWSDQWWSISDVPSSTVPVCHRAPQVKLFINFRGFETPLLPNKWLLSPDLWDFSGTVITTISE